VRILQINNYADPIGGAEVYALSLTRELGNRGHDVSFFGTAPDHDVEEDRLRIVRRPRYDARVLFRDSVVAGALEQTLRCFRPELIHLHNVFSLGVDVLARLRAADVPVVQTVHDFSLLCPNSWCVWADGTSCSGGAGAKCFEHECEKNYPFDAEVALHTLLKQRALVDVVDLSICPSIHLADLMRAHGSRQVVHLNYFIDPIGAEPGLERSSRDLLFVGRLQPEKGVVHLLDAMPLILRSAPDVRLTIVGGGALAGDLKTRAGHLGLNQSVTFLDHVPREALGRFYASSTACVLPSIWSENSPLVAYECMSAGLPMIASRIGGIPELVVEGEAGYTFRPRDHEDLARSVLRLLELPAEARARMSAAMRARALSFQAAGHVGRLEELYAKTREGRGGNGSRTGTSDDDLLTLLAQSSQEKQRLAELFLEHVAHIRHLETALTEKARVNGGAPAEFPPETTRDQGANRVLMRLARAFRTGWARSTDDQGRP
jgi:glycosyltransferase involved in cell wall biosynthesis